MAGHGPPPKHPNQRRRRNTATTQVTKLPAGGRRGRAPKWPIPVADEAQIRKLEAAIWAELWKTPQAEAWERLGYFREVAQYVRWKVLAEFGSLDAAREARMLSDRLGLTPLAMKHLLWEIDQSDEVGDRREQRGSSDARRRLRAVDPAAAK